MKKLFCVFVSLLILVSFCESISQWKESSFGILQAPVKSFGVQGTTIWAGTDGQGLYSTVNGGKSWNPVDIAYLTNYFIRGIIVEGDMVFAGTGGGVYLTTNKGTDWNVINGDITSSDVQCIALMGNYLFAGTSQDGVFVTTDMGNSWRTANIGLINKKIRCLIVDGNNIYAGTEAGVFVSGNKGSGWTSMNNGLTSNNVRSLIVSGNNIFAGSDEGGIFTANLTDKIWSGLNNDLKDKTVLSFCAGGQYLLAGTDGNGIYFSADGGITWMQTNGGLTDQKFYSFGISGNTVYAGSDKRVFKANISDINPITIHFVNSNSISLCQGDSIKIDSPKITGGTPPYVYHWKPNSGISDSTLPNPVFTPLSTTNYTLVVTDNSQPEMSSQAILTIKVLPKPATPQIVKEGDSLKVVFEASYYRWFKSPSKLMDQGTDLQIYKPSDSGSFYVMVMDTSGCKSDTSNHIIFVPKAKSVEDNVFSEFNIYPNPAINTVLVTFGYNNPLDNPKNPDLSGTYNIEISNFLGLKIYSISDIRVTNDTVFDMSPYPPGFYFLKIQSGHLTIRKKIILLR